MCTYTYIYKERSQFSYNILHVERKKNSPEFNDNEFIKNYLHLRQLSVHLGEEHAISHLLILDTAKHRYPHIGYST